MDEIILKLTEIYKVIKKDVPGLHYLSVGISGYDHLPGLHPIIWVHDSPGHAECFHSVEDCMTYIENIRRARKDNEILFRRFDTDYASKEASGP